MGPYVYKTVVRKISVWARAKTIEVMIQGEIETQVTDGWELFHYSADNYWQVHLFIFRKPADPSRGE